jgi:hypothetical protein
VMFSVKLSMLGAGELMFFSLMVLIWKSYLGFSLASARSFTRAS